MPPCQKARCHPGPSALTGTPRPDPSFSASQRISPPVALGPHTTATAGHLPCRSLQEPVGGSLPPALPITLLPKWPSKNTILITPASYIRPFPASSEPTKQYQNSTEQKAHQPYGCPARSILSSSQIPARLNCSSAPSSGPLHMLFPVCLP